MRRFAVRFVAATALLASVAAPASAATVNLTKPVGLSVDAIGEAYGDAKGVVVTWNRIRPETGKIDTIHVRRFSSGGTPLGRQLTLQSAEIGYGDPEAVPLGGDKVAGFWVRGVDGLVGRTGNLATGALGPVKVLHKVAEAYTDVAPLSNGNVLALFYWYGPNFASKRVHAMVLSPTLATVAGPIDVSQSGPGIAATAAPDFAAVPSSSGRSLVIWRDRVDGNVYVVPLSAAGKPLAGKRRINQLSMPTGSFGTATTHAVAAARLTGGRIAVAWVRLGGTTDDDLLDVQVRVLSATGVPVGPERRVTATSAEEQLAPDVVALPNGRLTVAWTNHGTAVQGRPTSYFIRSFGSDGTPTGAARRLFSGPRGFEGVLGVFSSAARLAASPAGFMHVRSFGTPTKQLRAITGKP